MNTEREVHSFLFADLVGFTALTAAHGDDTAADLAVQFAASVRDLARRHELEFVKAMGDAVMVRGASAARMVQLALCLAHDEPSPSWRPPVRIGVHTGSAVARDGDWFGATVNLASRLTACAQGGEVLITEQTFRRVRRRAAVDLVDRGVRLLRDVPEPVRVFAACPVEVDAPARLAAPLAVGSAA
jgi:adenylate cyclase